jgi:hypothetical protein
MGLFDPCLSLDEHWSRVFYQKKATSHRGWSNDPSYPTELVIKSEGSVTSYLRWIPIEWEPGPLLN